MQRCSRCILPSRYPGITYDERGVCNYCHSHRMPKPRGEAALQGLIESCRNSGGEYDCVLALSGGRDSSFAAYYVVRVLGLNALAYTSDNGFMPEQTRENLSRTTRLLGMDHTVTRSVHMRKSVGHILSAWMREPSPAMVGFLCTGCRTAYVRGLVKTARDYQCPLVLTGGGEPERSFAQRLLSSTGSRGKTLTLISGFLREVIRNPRYLGSVRFLRLAARELYHRYLHRRRTKVRTTSIFRYIAWNEEQVTSMIEDELGWKKAPYSSSSWRSDCKLNELKNFLYLRMLGFTKHDELLSGMVRRGLIAREEALERLTSDNVISDQFVAELLVQLGLSFGELQTALTANSGSSL
jgi:glucosamine--fructose-6-phosphate aminotransferase (isomerizing)